MWRRVGKEREEGEGSCRGEKEEEVRERLRRKKKLHGHLKEAFLLSYSVYSYLCSDCAGFHKFK